MKSVELESGKFAIPVNLRVYLHKYRMLQIVTDLIYHRKLTFESGKKEVMTQVRSHLFLQGVSVYNDWYDDTDATTVINELYDQVKPWLENMFPEIS